MSLAAKKSTFLATIKERRRLNPFSDKETYHIVLDIKGADFRYQVGDCIGIYPQNCPDYVEHLLQRGGLSGEEIVKTREKRSVALRHFLLDHANLNKVPQKLLPIPAEMRLEDLMASDRAPSPVELSSHLLPLMPRFYSIASSMAHVGEEIHLTVAVTTNPPGSSLQFGTCSDFLCSRAPLGTPIVPLFHHPAKRFKLSEESFSKPLIMIGPGTGIAPFLGFMQERVAKHATPNWLFFGERSSTTDFYYEEYWKGLVAHNWLQLETAFSRDQENKLYVQHRLYQHKKQLWDWLERGAYLYVCGDAFKMAKDVHQMLHTILIESGGLSVIKAKEYIKKLRAANRYLRDVY